MADTDRATMVTYCGAYCGGCSVRNGRIRYTASELVGMPRGYGYHERAPAMARCVPAAGHYAEAMAFLEWLTTEDCAAAAGAARSGGSRLFRPSLRKKGLAVCWECDAEASCEKIGIIDSAVPQMRENRKRIGQVGMTAWAREQDATAPS